MTCTSAEDAAWSFELLGVSHKTAPIAVRERFALSAAELGDLYTGVRALPGLGHVLLLSTCNRIEVYAFSANGGVAERLMVLLRQLVGPARIPEAQHFYRAAGEEAVRHLMRVAAGLDSVVVGETQILGQIREAYERSCAFSVPHPTLDRIMHAVFTAGRRSHGETDIGRGPSSVASAMVRLAAEAVPRGGVVAVIGAGETGRLAAEHFAAVVEAQLIIVNRSRDRAEVLARRLGGCAWPWERLLDAVVQADVVATALRVERPVLTHAQVELLMSSRRARPLALFDLGMPRNVEPSSAAVANVHLRDLEALNAQIETCRERRQAESIRVERIIDEEVEHLAEWHRARVAAPIIATLREAVEECRREEVAHVVQGLSASERAAVDRATRAVVNKLLHGPMTEIRVLCQKGEDPRGLEAVRRLVQRFSDGRARLG